MSTDRADGSAPLGRAAWLASVREEDEQQEDLLSPAYDERWGEVDDLHRTYIETFLSSLPEGGGVLDAACGTGKYFRLVLQSGRSVLGVDHSEGQLARAREKFPGVRTEKRVLRELPYQEEFDGVICVDAMEFVPPEDWPAVLGRFRSALRAEGWLYFTVELARPENVREATDRARRSGLPVVGGEVMWDDPEGAYYHHYPSIEQVRTWVGDAGFVIDGETEGPWEDDEYAYHHVLAHATSGSVR
jgi:cyclopropane fatty-acyl-phospholipid synthase-like methyltransferase